MADKFSIWNIKTKEQIFSQTVSDLTIKFYVLLIVNRMNFKNSSRVENHKGFNLQKPQIQKLLNFLRLL